MAAIVIVLASVAQAHHGKDYIEVEGASTPERGEYMGFSLFGYHSPGRGLSEYWALEPGALYPLTDDIALEGHAHLTNAEKSAMTYESTALEVRARLAREGTWMLDPAASVEYEFSAGDEPDILTARLILGRTFHDWNATVNYWVEQPLDGGTLVNNYGFGVNHSFLKVEKIGLELFGTLGEEAEHYVMPSIYLPVGKMFALKAGLALGLTSVSENVSFRSGIHLLF